MKGDWSCLKLTLFCRLSTFGDVWRGTYGMEKGISSLHYLSLGVGFIIGLQISHPLIDGVSSLFKTHRLTIAQSLISHSYTPASKRSTKQTKASQNGVSPPCSSAASSAQQASSSTVGLPKPKPTGLCQTLAAPFSPWASSSPFRARRLTLSMRILRSTLPALQQWGRFCAPCAASAFRCLRLSCMIVLDLDGGIVCLRF